MKKQVLWKIHCQFRKEVPYNNRKTSKVSTAIGGTGHDGNFFACTGECGRLTLGNGCQVYQKYEGWHGPEHHPYVAYGHRIRKGEKFPARLTESEGDSILRKDLKEMCALFRHLGKDSLLVACLAYQVGPYKLLGYGKMLKSTLIRKLEACNRDIYANFIRYCHYKGKKIPSIERRRKEEYKLLFIP